MLTDFFHYISICTHNPIYLPENAYIPSIFYFLALLSLIVVLVSSLQHKEKSYAQRTYS